jgi:hypothetical protein
MKITLFFIGVFAFTLFVMFWNKSVPNYDFYTNKIKSQPNGDFIDHIHKTWWYNYQLLEFHHGYIQWLFPMKEGKGMNREAFALTDEEIKRITSDPEAKKRVQTSYKMMLNFYGFRLIDDETGEISRSGDYWNRWKNFEASHTHNCMRITRILTSVGDLGYPHYRVPFLKHIIKEIFQNNQLVFTKGSLFKYWIPVCTPEEQKALKRSINR